MAARDELERFLGALFDCCREGLRRELTPDAYERARHEFVFHMSDSQGDLGRLVDLLNEGSKRDSESASTMLMGILYHIVPHLNAAARLLLDEINDPFAPTDT